MSALLGISREDCVRVLMMSDPARRNILSRRMCEAISFAIAPAAMDDSTKAVVIAAENKAFCAGADINDLIAASQGDSANIEAVYRSFMDVANFPLSVVAAVNSPAIGAGFNLALACDTRFAGSDAFFDCRFPRTDLHPGGGHTWLLQRALRWPKAMGLVLFGEQVDAQEAMWIGLVHGAASFADLLKQKIALAGGTTPAPHDLVIRTKVSMRHAQCEPYLASAERERIEQAHSLYQPAFKALVKQMRDSMRKAKQ